MTFTLKYESETCGEEINALLQSTVLRDGKRLRPLLIIVMGQYLGVEEEKIFPHATVIEKIHAASLTHDDVIDNAKMRRGRDSINIISSNKRAILAGDYLFGDMMIDLAVLGDLRLILEISHVSKALAEGEWLQLNASQERKYSFESIKKIIHLKTASLLSYCTQAPAIIIKLPEELILLSKSIGNHLGMAFQMVDDILDFQDSLKKESRIDIENDIINIVMFFWLNEKPQRMKEYCSGISLKKIIGTLDHSFETAEKQVYREVNECLTRAQDDISKLTASLIRDHGYDKEILLKNEKYLLMIVNFIKMRKF